MRKNASSTFPHELIQIIWSMTNRSFITWNRNHCSSVIFNIQEGLMQGTVNSPELFNIFTKSIPLLFNLNSGNNTYATTFADDLIILVGDKNPSVVQNKLQNIVNRIDLHYKNWNLKINPSKCETILFHKLLRFLSKKIWNEIKLFEISFTNTITHIIDHKKSVKYLGVQLDYLFRFNLHIQTQLEKAKKSFKAYSRIFYNKILTPKAKIICYLLLIRLLITYASPIWWNMSARI